jgi:hypothetical protein
MAGTSLANWPRGGPDVQIDYRAAGELKLPKRQLRKHSKQNIAHYAAIIRRCGQLHPIVVDAEFRVITGLPYLLAAWELGIARVPTIRVEHLSEDERRILAIAETMLVENGEWDMPELALELSELLTIDEPVIELTGFSTPEIDNIIVLHHSGNGATSCTETDAEAPEPQEGEPVARLGDLFLLGEHRLLCGDARDEASYRTLLGSELARAVFSDNPYDVRIANNVSGLGKKRHGEFVMGSGEMSKAEFTAFLTTVFPIAPGLASMARSTISAWTGGICARCSMRARPSMTNSRTSSSGTSRARPAWAASTARTMS